MNRILFAVLPTLASRYDKFFVKDFLVDAPEHLRFCHVLSATYNSGPGKRSETDSKGALPSLEQKLYVIIRVIRTYRYVNAPC